MIQVEFQFIKLDGNNDEYPTYKYDENSILHQIIKDFSKKGCKFISILDLKQVCSFLINLGYTRALGKIEK